MRIEQVRTYPGDKKKVFDYLNDFRNWPTWRSGIMEIIEPDKAAWSEPGDKVRFAYRLLGRRIEAECILDEVREAEYERYTATSPLGDMHEEWFYADAGDDGEPAFTLKGVIETDEPTSVFGRVVDKMVVPRVLERDLIHSLDNFEMILEIGLP